VEVVLPVLAKLKPLADDIVHARHRVLPRLCERRSGSRHRAVAHAARPREVHVGWKQKLESSRRKSSGLAERVRQGQEDEVRDRWRRREDKATWPRVRKRVRSEPEQELDS